MPKANAGMGPMSLVKWTLIGLLVLPAAELFAFFLMAALGGWPFHRHLHRGGAVAQKVRTRRSRRLAHRLRSGRDSSTAFGNARHGNDARRNPSDISGFYNGPLGRRVVAARGSPVGRSKTRDVRAQFPAYPARRSRHRA